MQLRTGYWLSVGFLEKGFQGVDAGRLDGLSRGSIRNQHNWLLLDSLTALFRSGGSHVDVIAKM